MDKLDKLIEQFVKPQRFNFKNSLYDEKEFLPHFERVDFNIVTFDKKVLICIFFRLKSVEKPPFTTVLYNHSHGSCKFEGASLLGQCYSSGISLLIYDSRGSGESGDDAIYFGAKEKIDILFLVLHLCIVYEIDSFILWGRSIGCNAVLQFYQTLISRDGDFLNRIMKLQHDKINSVTRTLPNGKVVVTNNSKIQIPLYPEKFNKFINQYFDDFLEFNEIKVKPRFEIAITIKGLVLDSPYESFVSFINDNIKKLVNFMPGMVSSIATLYLKNWMSSRLEVDIEIDQNIELVGKINLNTVFIISDKDEIVSFERYQNLTKSFAEKCPHKNACVSINTGRTHGSKRTRDLIKSVFQNFDLNKNQSNKYSFVYLHHKADHQKFPPAPQNKPQFTRFQSGLEFESTGDYMNNASQMQSGVQQGISLYRRRPQSRDSQPNAPFGNFSFENNLSILQNVNFDKTCKTTPNLNFETSPIAPTITSLGFVEDSTVITGEMYPNKIYRKYFDQKSSINTSESINEVSIGSEPIKHVSVTNQRPHESEHGTLQSMSNHSRHKSPNLNRPVTKFEGSLNQGQSPNKDQALKDNEESKSMQSGIRIVNARKS
jgi:hypothetical protein